MKGEADHWGEVEGILGGLTLWWSKGRDHVQYSVFALSTLSGSWFLYPFCISIVYIWFAPISMYAVVFFPIVFLVPCFGEHLSRCKPSVKDPRSQVPLPGPSLTLCSLSVIINHSDNDINILPLRNGSLCNLLPIFPFPFLFTHCLY